MTCPAAMTPASELHARECWCGGPVTSTDPDVSFCPPCLAHVLSVQYHDEDGTICYERDPYDETTRGCPWRNGR